MQNISIKNLTEAKRYFPNASDAELEKVAERQYRARVRILKLKEFYSRNYCRMTRLHLLASCAVMLGRFGGFSETFDRMGEYFMPFDAENQPRTSEWREFIEACERKLPVELREELWLAAHFKNLQNVRKNGLYARFEAEAMSHKNEPI